MDQFGIHGLVFDGDANWQPIDVQTLLVEDTFDFVNISGLWTRLQGIPDAKDVMIRSGHAEYSEPIPFPPWLLLPSLKQLHIDKRFIIKSIPFELNIDSLLACVQEIPYWLVDRSCVCNISHPSRPFVMVPFVTLYNLLVALLFSKSPLLTKGIFHPIVFVYTRDFLK